MVELCITYDIVPGVDQKALGESVQGMIGVCLKAPGLVELRANRNFMGSPRVRTTLVWRDLSDWSNFVQTDVSSAAWDEFSNFVTNVKVDAWGPSPVVPEPLRPEH